MDPAPRDGTTPSAPELSTPRQSCDASPVSSTGTRPHSISTGPSSTSTRASSIGTRSHDVTRTPRTSALTRVSADLTGHGHARSMSAAETRRKNNSFSLTFPINTTAIQSSPAPSPTRHVLHSSLSDNASSPVTPTDATFLTAVAAQERRVLELKEELSKAEGELKRLKQEWALHEAQRKRHSGHRPQKLQPFNLPTSPSHSVSFDDDQGVSLQQEMERRRTLLNGTKQSNRTVFSGSRHTRTLSLLSPTMSSKNPAPLPPKDVELQTRPTSPTLPERLNRPKRLSTNDLLNGETSLSADTMTDLGIPRDVLVKTGKQMATDFRDGLWTFIEDLRQATVGDEIVNGTTMRTGVPSDSSNLRKMPSRTTSLKAPSRPGPHNGSFTTSPKPTLVPTPARSSTTNDDSALLDLGASFWRENGVEEPRLEERPVARKPSTKRSVTPQRSTQPPEEDFTSWDNWESPPPVTRHQPNHSISDTSVSDVQTNASTSGTSPSTSISSKRDSIPWPALTKLAPSSLRRTASNLMADWERSLTPPTDDRGDQTDYMGRAISPTNSLSKDRKAD